MSIKRTILTIHPMIRNALLLIPLLAIVLLYFLQEGISIDSLKVGHFKVQGLYLKLDNKLTLKVEKLTIPKANEKQNFSAIDETLRKVKRVLTFFEYIELNSVRFTNDEYRIIYADDTIYINNNEYEIAGMIIPQKGGMTAKIPLINIKKYNLTLQGEMTYGYRTQKSTFQGTYKIQSIEGNLSVEILDSKVGFLLNSQETDDISQVLDMFAIPKEIRVWIDKKVQAKRYKLLALKGRGTLDKEGFKLDMAKTDAKAVLKEAKIKFDPKLQSVVSKEVTVRLHENRLDFDLKSPYYHRKSLSGSQAALLHLTGESHLRLLLKLKLHSRYDKEIERILKVYDVQIPLIQKSGKIRAVVALDIDLEESKTKVEGRAFLSKGVITIGGTRLALHGGEVTFTSNHVALWNVDLYESWYRGRVNGFINLSTKKAKLKVDIKQLTLGSKGGTSLHIWNKKKLPVLLNFKERVQFDIPMYHLKIEGQKKGGVKITNSNIKPLLPYIKGLPLQISSGKFSVFTKDYTSYAFSGEAQWKHSYIYKRGGYISKVPFKGRYQNDTLVLQALNEHFLYESKKSLIRIKNINIDAKKMLERNTAKKGNRLKRLKVKGRNSIIRYGKYVLLTDSFDLSIRGKNTTFTAIKEGDRVRLEKNGNSLVVHANKIKDTMLKALIHFGGLQGGRYSLELLGNINGEMRGVIDIKGGAIESFKAYNDLIALFNTIPALMTLSDPGFSKKGFVVRDGKIEFRILKDRVVFDNIYLNGKSATIAGKGTVELDSGKLNIDLAVRTAREVGKVLGSLPLVGYILFGKDKSITTGVKITGTLDKPNAKTNPVQEALLYPLELIKRTVTSPAHIINK